MKTLNQFLKESTITELPDDLENWELDNTGGKLSYVHNEYPVVVHVEKNGKYSYTDAYMKKTQGTFSGDIETKLEQIFTIVTRSNSKFEMELDKYIAPFKWQYDINPMDYEFNIEAVVFSYHGDGLSLNARVEGTQVIVNSKGNKKTYPYDGNLSSLSKILQKALEYFK